MNIQTIDTKQVVLKEAATTSEQLAPVVNTSVISLPNLAKSNSELIATDWTNANSFGGEPTLSNEVNLPQIDCDFLAPWVSNYIYALSYQYKVSAGTPLMQAWSILSTCLQGKFTVSPFKDNRHLEPLNLWTLAVCDNERRRLILDAMIKPIIDIEKQIIQSLQEKLIYNLEYGHDPEFRDAVDKAQIRYMKNKAAKIKADILIEPRNSQNKDKDNEAEWLLYEASKFKAKKMSSSQTKLSQLILTNDITKKNLHLKLIEHKGKLAILSDDSSLLKFMSSPDFLRLYSDGKQTLKLDDKYIDLNHIGTAVGLIVPPEILKMLKIKSCPYVKELASKLLFNIDNSTAGRYNLHEKDSITEETAVAYVAGIEVMLNVISCDANTKQWLPEILTLDEEALELWLQLLEELKVEFLLDSRFEALKGWIVNLPGQVLRIAGIVHIANLVQEHLDILCSLPEEERYDFINPFTSLSPLSPFSKEKLASNLVINKETIFRVVQYLKQMFVDAKAAYGLLEIDNTDTDYKYILELIYKHFEVDETGAIFVRQRTIRRAARFPVGRLAKALNELREYHILSPLQKLPTRKPTYVWYANPLIFKPKLKKRFELIIGESKRLPYIAKAS